MVLYFDIHERELERLVDQLTSGDEASETLGNALAGLRRFVDQITEVLSGDALLRAAHLDDEGDVHIFLEVRRGFDSCFDTLRDVDLAYSLSPVYDEKDRVSVLASRTDAGRAVVDFCVPLSEGTRDAAVTSGRKDLTLRESYRVRIHMYDATQWDVAPMNLVRRDQAAGRSSPPMSAGSALGPLGLPTGTLRPGALRFED